MNFKLILSIFLCGLISVSCTHKEEGFWTDLGFSSVQKLGMDDSGLNPEALGSPEVIWANGENLVALDFHDGQLFTYVNLKNPDTVKRFGTIGMGPGELMLGTVGYFDNDVFRTFYDRPLKLGATYFSGDSIITRAIKCTAPLNLYISTLRNISDTTYVAVGNYDDKSRFVTFDSCGRVIDSCGSLILSENEAFNHFHRFLANQGRIAISPDHTKCAVITFNSDNIDFIDITDGRLSIINSIHLRTPDLKPVALGKDIFQLCPSEDTRIGYVDVTSNSSEIFALYDVNTFAESNHTSPYVLTYNWDGKPERVFEFPQPISAIAANEDFLFLLSMDEAGEYHIYKAPVR